MVWMAIVDLLSSIKLFNKHHAHHLVRPSFTPKPECKVCSILDFLRDAIGPANNKGKVIRGLFLPLGKVVCQFTARKVFSMFIKKNNKRFWRYRRNESGTFGFCVEV